MAAGPLTPHERDRIRALHADGTSCKEIARQLGRSPSTISKAAAAMGLAFDRAQTAAATRAKQADAKARRADLSLKLLDDAERLRQRLWQPSDQVISTPKGPARVRLDLPPARDVRDIMTAVHTAVRGHVDIERLDADSGTEAAKSMLGALAEGLQIAYTAVNGTKRDD